MEIEKITLSEYASIFQKPMHIYNSVPFNDTVSTKCEECCCFLLHEGKTKIGLIGGIRGNAFYSPYSAPFGGFSFQKDEVKLEYIMGAVDSLESYLSGMGTNKIVVTLPPYFYNERLLSKTYFAFTYKKYDLTSDINYHFRITDLVKYDTGEIDRSARNNLRRATHYGLAFRKASDDEEKKLAYAIIRMNKEIKNRPLYLTMEYILNVANVIEIDFFLVSRGDDFIASAIVYHVAPQIVQVVYWGNLPDTSIYKPMNFLACNLFRHYSNYDIRFVDLGISSENGTPNFGLCDFKENIGCTPSIKCTFTRLLNGPEST